MQRSVIQLFVFLDPADEGYPEVGDSYASDGETKQQHGEKEPVDIVDGHIIAGELEQ